MTLVSSLQAANKVVVLDGFLGFLDTRVAGAEGVTQRELYISLVVVAHGVVGVIPLRDISLGFFILVQDGISTHSHRQTVVLEEGTR